MQKGCKQTVFGNWLTTNTNPVDIINSNNGCQNDVIIIRVIQSRIIIFARGTDFFITVLRRTKFVLHNIVIIINNIIIISVIISAIICSLGGWKTRWIHGFIHSSSIRDSFVGFCYSFWIRSRIHPGFHSSIVQESFI